MSSITKGVLVQNDARTVAGFSHVMINRLEDDVADLLLLCGDDVFSAGANVVSVLFKQAFMSHTKGSVDVSIAWPPNQSPVLNLSDRDAAGNNCTLAIRAVHGEAKHKALQLFTESVPMLHLHQHPAKSPDKTIQDIMSSLEGMAAAATHTQALIRMCAKLANTRARENSALQARLENWGGVYSSSH
jgi:hypothetical protein